MAYKITLEGSLEGQKFIFRNYDDALQFASLAVDNGIYVDYHYEDHQKVFDPPHPILIVLQGVDDDE